MGRGKGGAAAQPSLPGDPRLGTKRASVGGSGRPLVEVWAGKIKSDAKNCQTLGQGKVRPGMSHRTSHVSEHY